MNAQSSHPSLRQSVESNSPPRYFLGETESVSPGYISGLEDTESIFDQSRAFVEACGEDVEDNDLLLGSWADPSSLWYLPNDKTLECIRSSTDLFHQASTGQPGGVQRTSSVAVITTLGAGEDLRMQEIHSRERLGAIVVFNSLEQLNMQVSIRCQLMIPLDRFRRS